MKRVATARERHWMAKVAALGCVACTLEGYYDTPAEVHHVRARHGWGRTSHYATIGLCAAHHRTGPTAVHKLSRDDFTAVHGMSELGMLAWVYLRLGHPEGEALEEEL